MRSDGQGFTIIESIVVLVIVGLLAAIAVPKYYDVQEEARMKAATAAVAEAQARINLAFAQYVLAGQPCAQLESVYLREPWEGESTAGKLFIGDAQDTWGGKVGGWTFLTDVKNLEVFHATTPVEAVLDPDGRRIDLTGAGLFLHFPECGATTDRNGF
ncbi:MAG: prepilin-type N-terminal cleavage/methylation domain-containing protein [Bilophila sp.]